MQGYDNNHACPLVALCPNLLTVGTGLLTSRKLSIFIYMQYSVLNSIAHYQAIVKLLQCDP